MRASLNGLQKTTKKAHRPVRKIENTKKSQKFGDRRDFNQHDTEAFTAFLYLHYTKLEAKKK